MRALAITGIVTASWISRILSGSAMRATPPSRRMSAGTRSSAITAHAPASSAMRAWSAVVTSMITPPFNISASPLLTRIVPISAISAILASALQAAEDLVESLDRRGDRPQQHRVLLRLHVVRDLPLARLRSEPPHGSRNRLGVSGVRGEGDRDCIARLARQQTSVRRGG